MNKISPADVNNEFISASLEISLFFGIRVSMYYDGHNPPHIHVEYAGYKASIDIQNAIIMSGYLPARQLKLVLAWVVMYQDELMQNWELAKSGRKPDRIPPLARR